MPKIFSKFLISVLASFILIIGTTPSAMAQTTAPAPTQAPALQPWYNQSFPQFSAKVFGGDQNEIFGERYTYAQINWIINSLTAIAIGSDINKCITAGAGGDLKAMGDCASKLAPTNSNKTGATGGTITGLAYLTGSLVAFRPASGIDYVKTTASRLNIIPKAYAQTGAGFTTLSPIQTLWSVIRDICYALMVIIIIAFAFMIMFRAKISPQAVITVQSALPKIAIALILITFSYAIAGFLIDFAYVIVGLFATTIKIGGNSISNGSVVYLFGQLNSLNGLVSLSIGIIIFAVILAFVGAFVGAAAIPATLVVPVLGTGATLGAGIVLIVFAIFLLFILFRLFWLMIRTAAITVLLIVTSPGMIILDLLPGSGGFAQWFRNLAANLAVYPTVAAMIFLSHYFFWAWAMGALTGFWTANNPLNTYAITALNTNGTNTINLPGMPLATGVLGFFLSFIILFLIPRAAHVIEAMIQGKPVDVAGSVAQGAGPLTGPARFGVGAAVGAVGGNIVQGLPVAQRPGGQQLLQNILRRLGG
jgi:hypothetical protein